METAEFDLLSERLAGDWLASLSCPRCDHRPLLAVESGASSHHLCTSCDSCWEVVRGRLHAVDPIACAGCADRTRRDCITEAYVDFPRFGPAPDV